MMSVCVCVCICCWCSRARGQAGQGWQVNWTRIPVQMFSFFQREPIKGRAFRAGDASPANEEPASPKHMHTLHFCQNGTMSAPAVAADICRGLASAKHPFQTGYTC